MTQHDTRVLVIGAGINGLLTALEFVNRGASVTLVDRHQVPNPNSASYGNHRLIHPFGPNGETATKALRCWRDILGTDFDHAFCQTGVTTTWSRGVDTCDFVPKNVRQLFSSEIEAEDGQYVSSFGILFASKILETLANRLRHLGVRILSNCLVTRVDSARAVAEFEHTEKQAEGFDHIVVAAGWAMSSIKGLNDIKPRLSPIRTYVVYVDQTYLPSELPLRSVWVNLLSYDLWGVPPIYSEPAKFGFGGGAHPASEGIKPCQIVLEEFVRGYSRIDGIFEFLSKGRVASNQYARHDLGTKYSIGKKTSVIMSDNGEGFKVSPVIARKVVEKIWPNIRGNNNLLSNRRTKYV